MQRESVPEGSLHMSFPVEELPCFNGVLNSTGYCVCNQGWSAVGDLSYAEGYTCFVNIPLRVGIDVLGVCINIFLYYQVCRAVKEGNWFTCCPIGTGAVGGLNLLNVWYTCCRAGRAADNQDQARKFNAFKAVTYTHLARLPVLLSTAVVRLGGIPCYIGSSTFMTLCIVFHSITFNCILMIIFMEQFFSFYSIAERLRIRTPPQTGLRSPVVMLWTSQQMIYFCIGYSIVSGLNTFAPLYLLFYDDKRLGLLICYIGLAIVMLYGIGVVFFIRHMCDCAPHAAYTLRAHTRTHTHAHTYIHAHGHMCIHTHAHAHTHTHTHTYTNTQTPTHT